MPVDAIDGASAADCECIVQVNCVCGATDDDGKPMVECDNCRC